MSNISFNPLAWAIRPMYEKAIAEDPAFAQEVKEKEARAENPKSLAECADYILGEAFHWASEHRDGNTAYAGLPDDEMVNLIKHYYDEDNIEIRKVTGAKAQVAKTADAKKKEDKPKKEEKKTPKIVQIPKSLKESISDTHIQMTRPKDEREAKRNSKVQAEQVKVIDMFAGMWDEEAEETKAKAEEEEVEEVAVEDDDDLPM